MVQFSNQASLEEQAKMDDKHPMFENEPGEILTSDNFTKPRTEHYRSKWRPSQDSVYWINVARAQDEGSQFWQRRSNVIVVHSSVPPESIYKVISRSGERDLFEGLATPRPPPKVVLSRSWQMQQQQPCENQVIVQRMKMV